MLKDIFIDNNIVPKFSNPLDGEYKKLVKWLLGYNVVNKEDNAYLAVSNKIIGEYSRSLRNISSLSNNFIVIIDACTRQGRYNFVCNRKITHFKQKHFKKHVVRKFTCTRSDQDHIPVVMLSDRKYALSLDANFRRDINNFPKFAALAAKRPNDIPYKS